ncbi:MAG TPA: DsbA family protein [Promineifilum sp.]|nr:DsbA family protein [Promineifilum sp.]
MADLEQGSRLGITGTPAFFLNGNFLSGAQPYAVFRNAIETLLAEAG